MTSPYQPPSNQPGGDGWPGGGDINSPFGPSGPTDSNDGAAKSPENEEPSPYEGVQYELEGQQQPPPPPGYGPVTAPPNSSPPMSGPGYGAPPPPPPPGYGPPMMPPPSKSGSNTGLIVGGVVAGVVVLMVIAVVAFVAVANSGGGEGGGGGGTDPSASSSPSAEEGKYQMVTDPCSGVDTSKIEEVASDGEFTGDGTPDSGGYGYGTCSGYYYDSDFNAANLYVSISTFPTPDEAKEYYDSDSSSGISSCSKTDDVSGEQGTGKLGTDCSDASEKANAFLSVHVSNVYMSIQYDVNEKISKGNETEVVSEVFEQTLQALEA